jgi:hypothetical protein
MLLVPVPYLYYVLQNRPKAAVKSIVFLQYGKKFTTQVYSCICFFFTVFFCGVLKNIYGYCSSSSHPIHHIISGIKYLFLRAADSDKVRDKKIPARKNAGLLYFTLGMHLISSGTVPVYGQKSVKSYLTLGRISDI